MQLFSADARYNIYFFFNSFFLPTKSWKNHPKKLLRKTQIHFFPYCPELPKWPKLMFQIVAYRPTVYRTGKQGI